MAEAGASKADRLKRVTAELRELQQMLTDDQELDIRADIIDGGLSHGFTRTFTDSSDPCPSVKICGLKNTTKVTASPANLGDDRRWKIEVGLLWHSWRLHSNR